MYPQNQALAIQKGSGLAARRARRHCDVGTTKEINPLIAVEEET